MWPALYFFYCEYIYLLNTRHSINFAMSVLVWQPSWAVAPLVYSLLGEGGGTLLLYWQAGGVDLQYNIAFYTQNLEPWADFFEVLQLPIW
jgi:hypothetical protein